MVLLLLLKELSGSRHWRQRRGRQAHPDWRAHNPAANRRQQAEEARNAGAAWCASVVCGMNQRVVLSEAISNTILQFGTVRQIAFVVRAARVHAAPAKRSASPPFLNLRPTFCRMTKHIREVSSQLVVPAALSQQ